MKKDNINILYILNENSEYETIDTNDTLLNTLYEKATQYYLPPKVPNIKFNHLLKIGNLTLYLLGQITNTTKFQDEQNLQLLNLYLQKCINNEKFCNPKIFLSFVVDILKVSNAPKNNFSAYNYYTRKQLDNKIFNLTIEEKLNTICSNIDTIQIDKFYFCTDIQDLMIASLYEIFSMGYKIKKCRSCNKFFVTRESKIFCPYRSPKNEHMSCFEYSRNASYIEKRKNDPIQSLYNKIANTLRKRVNDAIAFQKDTSILEHYRQDYEDFTSEYNIYKKQRIPKGEKTPEELLEFLKTQEEFYLNKYKGEKKNGNKRNNKK